MAKKPFLMMKFAMAVSPSPSLPRKRERGADGALRAFCVK